MPKLSVLDLVPVRSGQNSAQAVAASVALAQTADELGYERYWLAEHHNMPAVASTTPPVLIAAIASRTSRIRVGSGGVMLPNHAPLIVAEQFAALEAIAPGRIDLGLGRAPGSDPVISALLNQSGSTSEVSRFPENITEIQALMNPAGATFTLTSGQEYVVNATPAASGAPTIWLLGSSEYSARLAARLGLPYVFANHFSGEGLDTAMRLYRSEYQPSEAHPTPKSFLTLNASVAPTLEEARARALPQLRMMARLRMGQRLTALETVEEAAAAEASAPDATRTAFMASAESRWLIGTPETARASLAEFAAKHGVDEVMVSAIGGSYASEPLTSTPGREQTLRLLAGAAS